MTAAPSAAELPPLLAQLQAHLRADPAPARLSPALHATLLLSPPEVLHQAVQLLLQDRARLRRAVDGLREANTLLENELHRLSQPPHCLGRLLGFDAGTGRALVGTAPQARIEVPVQQDVDPTTLVVGRDVLLNGERNCLLRALPAGAAPTTARVAAFRGFVDDPDLGATPDLRAALCGDAGGEVVVWVPPVLAARLQAEVEAQRPVRVCVDEYALCTGLCRADAADPLAAAARFHLDLQPVAADGVVGLAPQRARIDDAVQRTVSGRGAFVLAQGTTGCGKTHLARYALHRLQQHGEVVVLGLRASRDHRYHGQEETDVEELFACARQLVAHGKFVLLFVDELDRHFFRSRYGESVHVNAARATWLAQIGDDLAGVLLIGTTNKTANLPDELHNRVTHPLAFGQMARAQLSALLALYLPRETALLAPRDELLDAVTGLLCDAEDGTAVATVTLRDQTIVPLFAADLRQLSARFLKELAARLAEAATTDAGLTIDRARAIAMARVREVFESLGLSLANVADRTFVEFSPRNPPERVQAQAPQTPAADALFRYVPLEVADAAGA